MVHFKASALRRFRRLLIAAPWQQRHPVTKRPRHDDLLLVPAGAPVKQSRGHFECLGRQEVEQPPHGLFAVALKAHSSAATTSWALHCRE